jgi:hypothetical protein
MRIGRRVGVIGLLLILSGTAHSVGAQASLDTSRHRLAFVSVDGVNVPYLDWGGSGLALVFIPGGGNSVTPDDTEKRLRDFLSTLSAH